MPKEDLPSRVERLEKNMELQSNLNEQFIAEAGPEARARGNSQVHKTRLFSRPVCQCALARRARPAFFQVNPMREQNPLTIIDGGFIPSSPPRLEMNNLKRGTRNDVHGNRVGGFL